MDDPGQDLLSGPLGKKQPWRLTERSGTITPDKISAVVVVGFFGFLALGSLASGLFNPIFLGIGVPLFLFFGAFAGFMAPSLTSWHDVHWDADGIEGSSSLFGLTLGLARTRIAWSDIALTGVTKTQYWFIEAADGRRVHWSYLYTGHQTLRKILLAHRPDLRAGLFK